MRRARFPDPWRLNLCHPVSQAVCPQLHFGWEPQPLDCHSCPGPTTGGSLRPQTAALVRAGCQFLSVTGSVAAVCRRLCRCRPVGGRWAVRCHLKSNNPKPVPKNICRDRRPPPHETSSKVGLATHWQLRTRSWGFGLGLGLGSRGTSPVG